LIRVVDLGEDHPRKEKRRSMNGEKKSNKTMDRNYKTAERQCRGAGEE
jgi:hypothetical protein